MLPERLDTLNKANYTFISNTFEFRNIMRPNETLFIFNTPKSSASWVIGVRNLIENNEKRSWKFLDGIL